LTAGEEGQLLVGRQRNGPHIQLMALVEGSRQAFYQPDAREAAASLHAQLGEAQPSQFVWKPVSGCIAACGARAKVDGR
jgi:hypothetical protein